MALDWEAIKTEYITTDTSQSKLAKKYGVSKTQIANHSRAEGWVEARERYLNEVIAKAVQKSAARDVERLDKLMRITGRLIDITMDAVLSDKQFNKYLVTEEMGNVVREKEFEKVDTKALKDATNVLKDLTAMVREFYDIPTPAQRESQRIAAARLELERQKAAQGFDDDNDETGVVMIPEVRSDG